ncbi:MAG: hypothetical protein JO289_10525 [Xanthobacteraceae bacterium]|nr:hypothetical protein [Xanthobacteraceae bacterium]
MDPNDPLHREEGRQDFGADEARSANATWGWVAAAVFVAVVLFIAFTSGHNGTQTASNDTQPPASHMIAPPAAPAGPANTGADR